MTFESDDIVDTGATENTATEVETEQTEEWQPEQPNDGEETEAEQSDEEKAKQEAEQESKKKNRASQSPKNNLDGGIQFKPLRLKGIRQNAKSPPFDEPLR